jgi:hypothetical protein
LLRVAKVNVDVASAALTWVSNLVCRQFKRHTCRFFAPVAVCLLMQATTGCTALGYVVGNAVIPTAQSFPPHNTRAIPSGTEVEVFYLPRTRAQAPAIGATCVDAPRSDRPAEFSVATGAYAGIEGDQLVLNQTVSRPGTVSSEALASSRPAPFDTVRILVPLEQVSLIRTKPSSTPALVGTLVGAAMDVTTIVVWARIARNID